MKDTSLMKVFKKYQALCYVDYSGVILLEAS